MGRRPVWKAARQNRAAAGKTVCKCGGPPKNIILQTRAAWPGKDALVMQKFDAVLFDLDGTLIDSAPGILATFQKTFEAFGLTVGEQRLRPFLGPPLRSSMAQLLPQAQVEQAVETYRELYQTHGLDGCAPMPVCRRCCRPCGKRGLWCVWPHRNPTRWHCACCAILGWNRHLITLAEPAWTPAWTPRRP